MQGLEITLNDWTFRALVKDRRVLAINPAYFDLTGGLERRLYEIARRRNKTLHIWTCSQGLVRYGAEVQQRSRTGSGNTCDPMAALDTVLAHVDPAIFVFKDLHDHLDVRISQANMRTVRRLRDAAAALRDSYKTIVLVSPIMKIPLELSKDVAVVEYGTPSVSDFNALLDRIIEDVKDKPQISINLDAEGRERLIHAARGLTLKEAENVFAKTLVIDGKLDAEDIGVVFSEKQQIIRKSGTLEYYESHDRFADVAGLDNLKDWLRKRSAAFSERASQFGLPAPKGVLLLGIQVAARASAPRRPPACGSCPCCAWISAGFSAAWSAPARTACGGPSRPPKAWPRLSSGLTRSTRHSPDFKAPAAATEGPHPGSLAPS